MAQSLNELPVEILLDIVENLDSYSQRKLLEALRATSKVLNAKLMRTFGVRYYKCLRVPLNEHGFARLLSISKSEIGLHVESITVNCNTFHRFHV
jgi:hypothetical protein